MRAEADLVEQLRRFGAPSDGIVALSGPATPSHIPYLDLTGARTKGMALPDAIVELERRPVIYVVRGARSAVEIERLLRVLAQRGQAEHLAVLEPGQLHVFPLDVLGRASTPLSIDANAVDASLAIPRIALGPSTNDVYSQNSLHNDLLALLTATIASVIETTNIDQQPALSWVGCALFFRFLIDRAIVKPKHLPQICDAPQLVDAFAQPGWALQTSKWLDRVFNGDLLPLPASDTLGREGQERLCEALSKILHRTDPTGQLRFDWNVLDFGHIPVGLLSQVYENYSHRFEPSKAQRESIHYTPRAIAEYVVAEALHGRPDADRVRLLDPAAGAGVFLVAALRALVAERWSRTGKRPTRTEIRSILYNQIVGFDINEVALRLAAVSLYLTALELDPSPRPLEELRFDNLRGTTLHDVRSDADKDNPDFPSVGSLGVHISASHREAYDVILGNPPWTTWKLPDERTSEADNAILEARIAEVEKVVGEIVARKHPEGAYQGFHMVDKVPDLPFMWRALDWLRSGGRLALIVHARLLFKQTAPGILARNSLLSAMRTTGILNASALRQTEVWPDNDAQFCVVFAENHPPSNDGFTLISPYLDENLNQRGIIRIDASDAVLVHNAEVIDNPTLLKTLFRGTELDANIIAKLGGHDYPTLEQYWTQLDLWCGQGFQIGGKARKKQSARRLFDLREFTRKRASSFVIDVDALPPKFPHKMLLYPRERELYRGPLVLVPESPPPPSKTARRVHYSRRDVAFNRSFFGFSCYGHPNPVLLASYTALWLASDLVMYLSLMRSSRFGVERDTYLLEDLHRVWIRPLDQLSAAETSDVRSAAKQMFADKFSRVEVNNLVFRLLGLNAVERQTIHDTLRVSTPFHATKDEAQRRPSVPEIKSFAERLRAALAPFFSRRDKTVKVQLPPTPSNSPWIFLRISLSDLADGPDTAQPISDLIMRDVVDEADRHGASLLTVREPLTRSLLLGVLAQFRFWTSSRAWLVAAELRRVHEDYLVGSK